MNSLQEIQNLTVRAATIADDRQCRKLFIENHDLTRFSGISPNDNPLTSLLDSQYKFRTEEYAKNFPGNITYIIESDGDIVGCYTMSENSSRVHLLDISISPSSQRNGYGSAIIRKLQSRCLSENKKLTLSVNIQNAGAIKLYESLNFRRKDDLVGGTHFDMHWASTYG